MTMLEMRVSASALEPLSTGASAGPSGLAGGAGSVVISDRALVEHGVGHLHEPGDVGPDHVVTGAIRSPLRLSAALVSWI